MQPGEQNFNWVHVYRKDGKKKKKAFNYGDNGKQREEPVENNETEEEVEMTKKKSI